jgi:competence protein ComEA
MKSRIQLALVVAVCAAVVVVGVVLWMNRMTPVSITIATIDEQSIQIYISGAVATPGVVEVPPGSRLQDVVDASGGFRADADFSVLNLAGRVGDGEHIEIPSTRATSEPMGEMGEVEADTGLININTATIAELDQLPGIGEVLSGRIVEYREANGPFESADELVHIDGISANLVESLMPLVTVGSGD